MNISNEDISLILNKILNLAKEYRKKWDIDLWESIEIEKFGYNEFIGGKAEAYEDCVKIIKDCLQKN